VYVSVSDDEVTLDEPADTKAFKVVVVKDAGVDQALRSGGWGRLDDGEALISVEAVRRAAAGRVPAGWDEDFEGMLGYARGKGWLTSDGASIRAHLEPNA
jgi:hypothetical protein